MALPNYEKKVNKSGDTMTGELNFENKNDYAVFKKTRTINNVDYKANFGISAAPSTRIEFQDANESTLGRLDVRSDGIYNGLSNRKLGEVANLIWGTSMSFEMQPGQHALVMISNTDCLMVWMSGGGMSFIRLSGSGAQVNSSGTTVTIKYSDNRNFTGNAIIM